MAMMENKQEARLLDLARMAARGVPAATAFLTPEDRASAEEFLNRRSLRYAVSGGYDEAERAVILLLPDYMEPESVDWDEYLLPVALLASGYVSLTHRSFLGALTALGIDRSALGDILLFPFGAVVFATPSIAGFLLSAPSPLERVGADAVKVTSCDAPPATREVIASFRRAYEDFSDVVASQRLDCAVSSFARLSREKAKALIAEGKVYLNHREATRPDVSIAEGDVISVRGVGKFRIERLKLTQKERVRIEAKRYI